MDPSQRVYRISSDAETVIMKRVGVASHKGGPKKPSPSMVLNSIILRYDSMMRIIEQSQSKKFDPDELDAIFLWIESQSSAHHTMVRIDKPDHNETMLKTIIDGAEQKGVGVLDTNRRRSLLRILTNNMRTLDMFSIADRMALRLSKRSKSVEG